MNIGIVICTFNRPEYLLQCLASVKAADLSQVATVLVVDDCSTDPETIRLINEFELEGVELIKAFSKENRSIKGSLLFGFDLLFNSCEVVANLDGDAIVTKDAFNRLLELHKKFPFHLKTGFNCSTKNKDGSVRHKILEQSEGYNFKYSVGGINMVFEKMTYLQIVKPALQKSLKGKLNWDHQACIASNEGYDKPVVVLEPSCVQHIGVETSSMNHMAGGEPPDVAEDFYSVSGSEVTTYNVKTKFTQLVARENLTLILDNVTLIAIDDNVDAIIKAADISCRHIEFGAVKLLSSKDSNDSRAIKIRHLGSKEAYSRFMMSDVVDYVGTPYLLTIQGDGWILDATKWNNEWLNYDYIGSPWYFHTDGMQVGNGAVSLRSRRLHQILKEDETIIPTNDRWIKECQEDHNICRIYRPYLESKYGIKFAPVEVAEKFAIEAFGRVDRTYSGQFGFHGKNIDFSKSNLEHKPY